MPWSLEQRDNKWCVVKQGMSDPVPGGCHSSRADAIKHQRALYANEARVASLYDELDERTVGWSEPTPEPEPAPVQTSPVMAEILALLAREQQEKSLVASVAEQQSLISQQFQEAAAERQALVAALGRMGSPTINLPEMKAPDVNVHVPAAQVDVHVPAAEVNVSVPDVNVHVPAPQVDVHLPAQAQKTVTFERDPLTQQVVKAEVTEQ